MPTSFSALSNSKSGIFGFSLADASIVPSLSSEHQQAIEEAIKVFEDANRSVGFVLVDMDTGVGFASNVDAEVYGASSFKAPFVAYVCSNFVDAGTVSLSSQIPSIVLSGDVYYASGQETIQQLIEWSVVDSDNASFGALREYFGGGPASTVVGSSPLGTNSGLQELMRTWLAGTGADASIADDEEWFPFLSARDMACLWTYLGNYLATGTDAANFLKQQLVDTDISFIRDALEGSGATVLSKAGWCNSSEEEYNSVCDSGIVELDGHAYLLTVMTGATYYDSSVQHVEDLIAAIFDARGDLEQLQQVG